MAAPVFVTRVRVGTGPDMVLISVESPSGDTGKGEIEPIEAFRMAMSQRTFAEVTELFLRTLQSMEQAKREEALAHATSARNDIPGRHSANGVPSGKH